MHLHPLLILTKYIFKITQCVPRHHPEEHHRYAHGEAHMVRTIISFRSGRSNTKFGLAPLVAECIRDWGRLADPLNAHHSRQTCMLVYVTGYTKVITKERWYTTEDVPHTGPR